MGGPLDVDAPGGDSGRGQLSGPASGGRTHGTIEVRGAAEHNLKDVDIAIDRGAITLITGVSGSGKSSLAFDTVLAEAQRRFFYTLSHYSRQFLDLTARPAVRSLTGLSPAIALAQNETPPSRRATVGTLTDASELVAVLFARFAEQRCPEHDLPTAAQAPQDIAQHLLASAAGSTLAICAPVAEAKKGTFKAQLTAFAERGFLKAVVDGELVTLAPPPALAREERHTIKLVIDYVKIKPEAEARLTRSIEAALSMGQGFGECFPADAKGRVDLEAGTSFSAQGGCPRCGFSWPRLDARHISPNSLGRCPGCGGLGVGAETLAAPPSGGEEGAGEEDLGAEERHGLTTVCASCRGSGLDPQLMALRLAGRAPHDLHLMPLTELHQFLKELLKSPLGANAALRRVADEAQQNVGRVVEIGLGYLTMARRIRSLSGGEAQRLKLAGILAATLRGVLYVLDEPSQGLHPRELGRLIAALRRLKDGGNTVIVVDHDEMLMRAADWIIDLGPGGGARGGRVMAKFRPSEAAAFARQSVTAAHLASRSAAPAVSPREGARVATAAPARGASRHHQLTLTNLTRNNLQIPSISFPLSSITSVTGLSGSGKSSLVLQTLYPTALSGRPVHAKSSSGFDQITSVSLVDRRPIAKSSVSIPASYLGVFTQLRDLYAAQPDAQVMGLTARSFSLSVDGGRCPECKGRGELSLSMRFLADARVRCPVCKGARYGAAVLAVRYQGLNLCEVLELTLDEVVERFKNHRKIVQPLVPAVELGLGYLKLGQPSASLSGGEAQRLKLVPHLAKRHGAGSLIILDEPTTGLHFEDVARLIAILRRLAGSGATIITIEHNGDVIAASDWVIELGPGAAAEGGRLVSQGPPNPTVTN
jgi:excinuclease ABC subunit A